MKKIHSLVATKAMITLLEEGKTEKSLLFETTTQTTSIWTQLTENSISVSLFPIAPFPLRMSANVFSHISEEAITAVILKATLFSAVELDKRQKKRHSLGLCKHEPLI